MNRESPRETTRKASMQYNTALHIRSFVTLAVILLLAAAMPARPLKADTTYHLYLPLITHNETSATPILPTQAALTRINYYRQLAGAPLLQVHPALTTSAQNHANYDLLNHGDPSAWVAGPHGEVAGKPGFTGESSGARALAAGYPWEAGWEVMNYFDDPARSVDDLMNSVYHRVGILSWSHQYVGYGHGRSTVESVDVIDFGHGATTPISQANVLVFPADRQTDLPIYGASETPDPLPPNGSYPI